MLFVHIVNRWLFLFVSVCSVNIGMSPDWCIGAFTHVLLHTAPQLTEHLEKVTISLSQHGHDIPNSFPFDPIVHSHVLFGI